MFTATNGHDALDIMRKTHIHVLVSDQRMPAMLGLSCSGAPARFHEHHAILLTGYSDLTAIVGSVNDGGVCYINKPWDHREIRRSSRRPQKSPGNRTYARADFQGRRGGRSATDDYPCRNPCH